MGLKQRQLKYTVVQYRQSNTGGGGGRDLRFEEEVEAAALFQVLCISILCLYPGLLQAISVMVTHFLLR